MNVLVDTSVWSLALRRSHQPDTVIVSELMELITEVRAQMIGPVRQELLSGIRDQLQLQRLRNHLRAFPDLALAPEDYETAAEYYNLCRRNGVQGSNTDFLICAIAVRHNIPVFTTDMDFQHFKDHLPLTLHLPRTAV